ncbi:MAG: hypothetical protein AAF170_15015 [Bacteroidota bacterium]
MIPLRSLFASVLLAVAFPGTVVAPAVHWAGHGLEDHGTASDHGAAHDHSDCAHHVGEPYVGEPHEDAHAGACLDCALIQKTLSSETTTQRFYTDIVGLERAVLPPEALAVDTDVATPEERGPPATA